MEKQEIMILERDQVEKLIKSNVIAAMKQFEQEKNNAESQSVTYTINQVAKRLGRSHTTISKLVKIGVLKVTQDNQILAWSLDEYLKLKNKSPQH